MLNRMVWVLRALGHGNIFLAKQSDKTEEYITKSKVQGVPGNATRVLHKIVISIAYGKSQLRKGKS